MISKEFERMLNASVEDEKEPIDVFCSVALLLLFVPCTIIGAFIDGWAITLLWKWFILGSFGLTAMPMKTAIGISFLFDLFKTRLLLKDNRKPRETLPLFLTAMLGFPLIVLVFAKMVLWFL